MQSTTIGQPIIVSRVAPSAHSFWMATRKKQCIMLNQERAPISHSTTSSSSSSSSSLMMTKNACNEQLILATVILAHLFSSWSSFDSTLKINIIVIWCAKMYQDWEWQIAQLSFSPSLSKPQTDMQVIYYVWKQHFQHYLHSSVSHQHYHDHHHDHDDVWWDKQWR